MNYPFKASVLISIRNGLSQRQFNIYNARRQCNTVTILRDETSYVINLSVMRHAIEHSDDLTD